jgi:two-component system sensor histidine kinase FlrB
MLDHLFTPFATTKSDGTGLGLAISRTIVEAHHGNLAYRSLEPTGACFTITLPVMDTGA